MLVKVPASVGNFAGVIDCAALTLDALCNVKVTPRTDGQVGIRYFGENGHRVPRNRSNLVVRAMESALHLKGLEFTGADFEVYSSVPVGVGLGSSTSAVLAGLIAADRLYSLGLNEKTLFDLARIYESRLDNLYAAWHGGFVACAGAQHFPVLHRTIVTADFVLAVVNPESKQGFPAAGVAAPSEAAGRDQSIDFKRAQVLAELFTRSDKNPAARYLAAQTPPSLKVVPGLEDVLNVGTNGVMGVFICGSGPAVGILSNGNPVDAARAVQQRLLDFGIPSTYGLFRPTNAGALELNAVAPQFVFPASRWTLNQAHGPVS